jgi:large subunit ribosomal protein L6
VSRIGKLPVVVPAGVQVQVDGQAVHVKGPKGEMQRLFSPLIGIKLESGQVLVSRDSEEKSVRALHGTTRALINNMVTGVSKGFELLLDVEGVGYRAEMSGANLKLYLGFSHPVDFPPPGRDFL